MGSKKQNLKIPDSQFVNLVFSMYYTFFVWIWLKNSIFGDFSNIYLLSAQNRVKWRYKIRTIAKKKIRPILIFFARDDAKFMPKEVCQVSCRYSNKFLSVINTVINFFSFLSWRLAGSDAPCLASLTLLGLLHGFLDHYLFLGQG